MNKEIELLNYIYQNTQMGIISIEQIIEINEDKKFSKLLNKQLNMYETINKQAIKYLNNRDMFEKEISNFSKIKTYFMINIQTITDKSVSHLAEMLIIGSTMGVIDTIKKLNDYNDNDYQIINLMKKLHEDEEKNIVKLKLFL